MANPINTGSRTNEAAGGDVMNQLRATFSKLPHDIPLLYFTQKFKEDVFNETTRQMVRVFRELSDKITFREYDLDHELAKRYRVERSSTLLIAPDRYNIR